MAELPSQFGVHPMMIHAWKKAPEIDEEQIRELHAKIGELAVANDFWARKLKPWGVK